MAVTPPARDVAPFLVAPRIAPPLDPSFRPAVLARRAIAGAVERTRRGIEVAIAVEQPAAAVTVRTTAVLPEDDPRAAATYAFTERLVKTMLWLYGGSRIWVDGPEALVAFLRAHYAGDRTGRFDARMIGEAAYRGRLEVVAAPRSSFPTPSVTESRLGGHLDGCRIGFDLGASDRKAAAVLDGEVVFSEEVEWDPARHDDPGWHLEQIDASIRHAAEHLPCVDAIGGSAAGIYVDNEVRVASLFRAVPPDLFESRVRGIFGELRERWHDVPFEVVNDGEVTALAGAMAARAGGLLGIALGSSQAAGYVTPEGALTPWLNELAFVPIDFAPEAPIDEWSGDRGCGVMYLSQQATARLMPLAGIEVEARQPLPERLVRLQDLMAKGDERATRVYESVGTYLGYALLEYASFYDLRHVLLLGRVTTGLGGDVIAGCAQRVLAAEDPAAAGAIAFHAVSERDKRHGQAVAAASLPRR